MTTSDIEKLQLTPRKLQIASTESECRLTRINETETGDVTPTPLACVTRPQEEVIFHDGPEAAAVTNSTNRMPTRPATAEMAPRAMRPERFSFALSSSIPCKASLSVRPLEFGECNFRGTESRSLRSHSDTNITTVDTSSPIIIRTSCMTKDNSTEGDHRAGSEGSVECLEANIEERGFSASLDNLKDSSYCIVLNNPFTKVKNDRTEAFHKNQLSFRTVTESSEGENSTDRELHAVKNLEKQTAVFGNVRPRCDCCMLCPGGNQILLPTRTPGVRCVCLSGLCSCYKQHAASVVNLPSLRKSRRTPGLDEISYDFMRASGAISGFSQLRSVKGMKLDREKQEMCSVLSPSVAAKLDNRGAVAVLAASTRPRLISRMHKKPNKAHSSQEAPTTLHPAPWASSFDSSCNMQHQSQDDELTRCASIRTDDTPPPPQTTKQSSLINRPTQKNTPNPETLGGVKNCKPSSVVDSDDCVPVCSTPKDSVEQEVAEEDEEGTITNSSDVTRPKRPYYCQKAQKFRNSWRTQSLESPKTGAGRGIVRERSLTMVESQSESDSKDTNATAEDRTAQVTVYLTRGARNPVKTILVNHTANNMSAINAARLRARRQKTFSNRNQWKSVQLSPTHDGDIEKHYWRGESRLNNASLCNSREAHLNRRCIHKTSCACTNKGQLSWKMTSRSPLLNSMASSIDINKFKQPTKSSEAAPTSILKSQTSRQTSENTSSDDEPPCLEPMFTLRQRRIQAMERHRTSSAFHNVGYRLGRRKRMFEQRSRASDCSLVFAITGILLMIIENELTSAQVVTKDSIWSLILKSLITCSTLALIGFIILYHTILVRILSFDDCIEDWQIAWDRTRVARLVIEILVCAIHPVPGNFTFTWPSSYYLFGGTILLSCAHCKNDTLDPNLLTTDTSVPRVSSVSGSPHVIFPSNKVVSIDIILSLPMFLRLYLIFRVVVLRSKLFTDTGSRSIGAMNKVNFTTQFVFKTFMTICPGTVLVAFILGFWAVLAWMLRACERVHDPVFEDIFNSMWLVAVTFLSIGYGDVVANTYCGRAISIVTGVLMKYYAANVLRETWLIYKHTKLVKKLNASTIRKHQRKFLRAIHGLRQVKLEQRKLQDNANSLIDLAKTQSTINDTVSEMRIQHTRLQIRLDAIEESLVQIQ
uniref:CaMBD domain-containing protein n=1 Tax=Mesocestoides corti TaxID=53468 RepID=A0A5K3FBS7_MESCO